MTWYIQKGEYLQRDQRIVFPFYRRLREDFNGDELLFEDDLIADESTRASRYPKDGVTRVNYTMTSDLRTMNRALLKNRCGR